MMSGYFRKFFIILLGIGFFTLCQAQIKDQLLPLDKVQLEGYIAEKLNAAYQNRILSQNTDKLVEPFANRTETSCWQSEFWGKWFTSAVLAYQYQPSA